MEKKTQQCSALLVTAPRVHGRRRDEDRCAVSPFIMLRQRMVCRAGLRCQQLTPHPTWHACVPAGRACPHGLDLHASQKLALDCAGGDDEKHRGRRCNARHCWPSHCQP